MPEGGGCRQQRNQEDEEAGQLQGTAPERQDSLS
jgi:hypothetical protein